MNKKEALAKIEELKKYVEELDKPTYSIGDRLLFQRGVCKTEEFIIAQVKFYHVTFISIESGKRWTEPVKVENASEITQEEFEVMTSGYVFTKI